MWMRVRRDRRRDIERAWRRRLVDAGLDEIADSPQPPSGEEPSPEHPDRPPANEGGQEEGQPGGGGEGGEQRPTQPTSRFDKSRSTGDKVGLRDSGTPTDTADETGENDNAVTSGQVEKEDSAREFESLLKTLAREENEHEREEKARVQARVEWETRDWDGPKRAPSVAGGDDVGETLVRQLVQKLKGVIALLTPEKTREETLFSERRFLSKKAVRVAMEKLGPWRAFAPVEKTGDVVIYLDDSPSMSNWVSFFTRVAHKLTMELGIPVVLAPNLMEPRAVVKGRNEYPAHEIDTNPKIDDEVKDLYSYDIRDKFVIIFTDMDGITTVRKIARDNTTLVIFPPNYNITSYAVDYLADAKRVVIPKSKDDVVRGINMFLKAPHREGVAPLAYGINDIISFKAFKQLLKERERLS